MTCKYCGSVLESDSKFCTTCGGKVEDQGVEKTVMVNRPTGQEQVPPAQPMQTPPPVHTPVQPMQPPVQPNPYLQQPYQPPVAPQYVQPMQPIPTEQPGESMAKAAQILGIISLFCCGGITAILAIVFGVLAKNQGYQGSKAKTGIICGIISMVLMVLFYIVYFVVIGASMSMGL